MTRNPLFRILSGGILLLSLAFVAIACSTAPEEESVETSPETPTDAPAGPTVGGSVGDLAPDFSLSATDGRMASLTEFKQANQPVVVYFFATW